MLFFVALTSGFRGPFHSFDATHPPFADSLTWQVRNFPLPEFKFFPDYLLPPLHALVNDEELVVRLAMAESLPSLALSSQRFLDIAQVQRNMCMCCVFVPV